MFTASLLLLVVPSAAGAEFAHELYTNRTSLAETTTFQECVFRDCDTSGWVGGALYLGGHSFDLFLIGCLFENCRVAGMGGDGGAFFVNGCRLLSVIRTTGLRCRAGWTGAFSYVGIAEGDIDIHDSATVYCSAATADTLYFYTRSEVSASDTLVSGLNVSASEASAGTGFEMYFCQNLSFHFSRFTENTGGNVLCFYNEVVNADIRCLQFTNNSCAATNGLGLICIASVMQVHATLFRGNAFDWFVGCSPITRGGNVTFVRCIFDFATITKTRSARVAVTRCVFKAASGSLPAECRPERTRRPSRTPR
jgi:hypothetical protein